MGNNLPSIVFGSFLLVVGSLMLTSQRRAAKELDEKNPDENERRFLSRRIRRRTQVAGMIVLTGILIPAGDIFVPWNKAPATFAVYCLIIIALAFWTILLAFGDIVSTRAYSAIELHQLQRKQIELQEAARRLQREESNGSPHS